MSTKWSERIAHSTPLWLSGVSFFIVFAAILVYLLINRFVTVTYDTLNPLFVMVPSVVAPVVVGLSFWRASLDSDEIKKRFWPLLAIVIGMAYSFVSGIFGYLLSIIFSMAFRDMTFDLVSTPLLLAAFAALISYFISEGILRFDRRSFAHLIFVQYIAGFFLAAIKTGDPDWWRESICSLGMPINGAPIYFNFTMVLTGLLLWAFYVYLRPTFKKLRDNGILNRVQSVLVKVFYFSLGAMTLILGLLPFGVNEPINIIHNFFGYGIYIFFAIFMIFAGKILNRFPLRFKVANYVLFSLGLSFFLSHMIFEYMTHGIMELLMALVLVSWLIIFVRTITILTTENPAVK